MNSDYKKPEFISKANATKILSKQRKVVNARDNLISDEIKIARLEKYLDEYDKSSENFSFKYYRNCGGPDSYPVQTSIGRSREKLSYLGSRIILRREELKKAEFELMEFERVIVQQINERASRVTGKACWPSELVSFDLYRTKSFETAKAEEDMDIKEFEAAQEEFNRAELSLIEEEKELDRLARLEWEKNLSMMTPEAAAREITGMKIMREAFASKNLRLSDIVSYVASLKSK